MEKIFLLIVVFTAASIGIFKAEFRQTKDIGQSDVTKFCNSEMILPKETEFEIEEA